MTGRSYVRATIALFLLAAGCSRPDAPAAPRAEYDQQTGRLRRLTFDVNGNGHHDAVGIMNGAHVQRVELDLDENGKVDRWDFYTDRAVLDRIGFSRRNDGVLDAQAWFGADRTLQRIEVATRDGGRFDRVEFYRGGILVRSEEDTNGDGRADKWEHYRPNRGAGPQEPAYAITEVAFDDTGSGVPQRRLIYEGAGAAQTEAR